MRLVLDTNVLIDATTDGPRKNAAREVIAAASEVCAPIIWRYEFVAVLTKHARLGNIS